MKRDVVGIQNYLSSSSPPFILIPSLFFYPVCLSQLDLLVSQSFFSPFSFYCEHRSTVHVICKFCSFSIWISYISHHIALLLLTEEVFRYKFRFHSIRSCFFLFSANKSSSGCLRIFSVRPPPLFRCVHSLSLIFRSLFSSVGQLLRKEEVKRSPPFPAGLPVSFEV